MKKAEKWGVNKGHPRKILSGGKKRGKKKGFGVG